jgi:hypothetical protein
VIAMLGIGFVAALAYYPIRKRALVSSGLDLAALTNDRSIFHESESVGSND